MFHKKEWVSGTLTYVFPKHWSLNYALLYSINLKLYQAGYNRDYLTNQLFLRVDWLPRYRSADRVMAGDMGDSARLAGDIGGSARLAASVLAMLRRSIKGISRKCLGIDVSFDWRGKRKSQRQDCWKFKFCLIWSSDICKLVLYYKTKYVKSQVLISTYLVDLPFDAPLATRNCIIFD